MTPLPLYLIGLMHDHLVYPVDLDGLLVLLVDRTAHTAGAGQGGGGQGGGRDL